MKKKGILIAIPIIIIFTVLTVSIILYSKNNNGLIFNRKQQAISEKENITIIDVTGLIIGKETEHEHIYKTMYDDNKHWEECKSCGERRNEIVHNLTTSWALGYESCYYTNSYTTVCDCGYSKTGHKPCVWDGKSYWENYYWHGRLCSVCNCLIANEYYLNGVLYEDPSFNSEYESDYYSYNEFCYDSNGKRITCNNPGTCVICGHTYNEKVHRLYAKNDTGEIFCEICKLTFGTYSTKIDTNSETPVTYTITETFNLNNNAYLYSDTDIGNGIVAGDDKWDLANKTLIYLNRNTWQQFTMQNNFKLKSGLVGKYDTWVGTKLLVDGILCEFGSYYYPFELSPNIISPIISEIKVSDTGSWSKNKMITILGTEHYGNVINAKILDSNGNILYDNSANVNWSTWTESNPVGSYSVSCIPDMEASDTGSEFTARITDDCGNSTEKKFTISKIDSIAPEPTSANVIGGDWSREKDFTFSATDNGIGNVQIGFNNVSDYRLASKNENEYSRNYKFVGDIYSPTDANVYYKDELGNVITQKITIDKLDNTAPTITSASFNNNKLNIISNDMKTGLGEGSGVVKYKYLVSPEKLEKPLLTLDNSIEVSKDTKIKISDFYKVKYVYIVAEDAVRKYK